LSNIELKSLWERYILLTGVGVKFWRAGYKDDVTKDIRETVKIKVNYDLDYGSYSDGFMDVRMV
jgi:hypothetical protein